MKLTDMEPGKGFKTVIFDIKDRSADCTVKLNSGESIGLVQAVNIQAKVGEFSTATVETICNKAEVEILQRNTELLVSIREINDYGAGYLKAVKEICKKFEDSGKENFSLDEVLELVTNKFKE